MALLNYPPRTLTCRLSCPSSIQEQSLFSDEPETPLRRLGSKVRHMTGSGWALTRLSTDLWVTSHSSREPSSYPASRSGPGPEPGWVGGGGGVVRAGGGGVGGDKSKRGG